MLAFFWRRQSFRFDCDIESDFVPKFETVSDGLRGGINADWNTLDLVIFDSLSPRWP